jgi:endonuclease/exonuclease/phosphatase family metal-dependent hydrolase
MRIDNAYTDCAPAALEYGNRLFVAFKDRDSQRIRLAATRAPGDESSWDIRDLDFELSGSGPREILTTRGPTLSVFDGSLFLGFIGDGNEVFLASMDAAGDWSGHGQVPDAQTSNEFGMADRFVAFRGAHADNCIHYTLAQTSPSRIEDLPSSRSNSGPSVADWTEGNEHQIIAYEYRSRIMVSHYKWFGSAAGWQWTEPDEIRELGSETRPDVRTDSRPGLAMHRDLMCLAYKGHHIPDVGMAYYTGTFWMHQGIVPGYLTNVGPALVSFRNETLYIIYREAGREGQICYGPVPVPDSDDLPLPMTAMTLNVRIHPIGSRLSWWGDDHPHHWLDRLPRIVEMIRRFESGQGPHLIGMQEVRHGQYDDLVEHLPGYESVWADRGGPLQGNEGQAIFFRSDRIELLDWHNRRMGYSELRRMGDCERDAGSWPFRNIVWGRFRDTMTDQCFYVYNTHFGGDTCYKRGQATIMAQLIAERPHSTEPFIVMGDLNTGLEEDGSPEEVFSHLYDSISLVIPYQTMHPIRAGMHFGTGNKDYHNRRAGPMIDFVLVPPSILVFDADIDRTMFTDAGRLATVPCYAVDGEGFCLDVGDMDNFDRMYSDHWAVWASIAWRED